MQNNTEKEAITCDFLFDDKVELSKLQQTPTEKKRPRPTFKHYDQSEQVLFPPSLLDWIPKDHMVLAINKFMNKLNREPLERLYKGGGTSVYDPIMMLKIVIYGYINGYYTSRTIAKTVRENINFRYLSGGQTPDFRTINMFISKRLTGIIDEIFTEVLMFLIVSGYIKLENSFVDGTIMNANAKKSSYVWKSNIEAYKERLKERVKEIMKEADRLREEEDARYGQRDLPEMGEERKELKSEEIEEYIKMVNDELVKALDKEESKTKEEEERKDEAKEEEKIEVTKSKEDKKKERKLRSIKKKLEREKEKLKKYEEQEKKLRGRNSYSKTDEDATFMRLKSGELVPGYMVIMGTENQFILNVTVHQKPSEADHFRDHMERFLKKGLNPRRVIGDSGYGSLMNYRYLENKGIESYLKYNSFRMEERGKKNREAFHRDKFIYKEEEDVFICPVGNQLSYARNDVKLNSIGEGIEYRIYSSDKCKECKFRVGCSKSPTEERTVRLNLEYESYKKEVYKRLTSTEGIELRKRRNFDVESVFGNIKHNMKFRRFIRRGLEKVKTEIKLISIALNIRKYAMMVS